MYLTRQSRTPAFSIDWSLRLSPFTSGLSATRAERAESRRDIVGFEATIPPSMTVCNGEKRKAVSCGLGGSVVDVDVCAPKNFLNKSQIEILAS